MTLSRAIVTISSLIVISSLVGCWGNDEIRTTCDELQPYQTVVPGERITIPEGLDSLDQYKEMPIPESNSPPRPAGSKCIEYPPPL
jgi:uncharacterized lipoprotein